MKLLKKITAKTVLGRAPNATMFPADAEDGYALPIMTVYGTVTGVKDGTHEFGDGSAASEYKKFSGNFAAIRIEDNEEYRAGVAILPEVAANVLAPVAEAAAKDNGSVNFGFQVIIVKRESAIRGYEFTAEPLTQPTESDPLDAIRATLALPAPASEAPAKKKASTKK